MASTGQTATDFRLQNERGDWVTLSELVRDRPILLVFYPVTSRLVCTKQLCAYQESFPPISGTGLDIVGNQRE